MPRVREPCAHDDMEETPILTVSSVRGGQGASELTQASLLDGPIDPRHLRALRMGLLWSRRRFLVRAGIAGTLVGLLVAFLSPERFTSTARLMPPESQTINQLVLFRSLAKLARFDPDSLGDGALMLTSPADVFASILSSRTVQNGIIDRFDLRKVYGKSTWEETRKELSRRTHISVDRKNPMLAIEVTDHDPQRAKDLVEEYISQLNLTSTQMNTSSSHRERVFLEQRLAEVSRDLESAEKELSQFASGNSLVDMKEQDETTIRALLNLEGQLIAEKIQLKGLREVYSDGNIRIRAEQARIAELSRQMQELDGRSDASKAAPRAPGARASLRKLPLLGVGYSDLFRRVKIEEGIFEALSRKYELAKVQEAKDLPSVTVLDPPEVPERRVFPQRLLLIAVGLCFGFLFATWWTFVRADWDHLDAEDPSKVLASSVYLAIASETQPERKAIAAVAERSKPLWNRLRIACGQIGGAVDDRQ